MPPEENIDSRLATIDIALGAWRQGDCVLGEQWFVHKLDQSLPITQAGRVAAQAGSDIAEQEIRGFVVVTQTCDVVRSCKERAYIEVCPVVEVDNERFQEVQRGRRPAYAFIPLLSDSRLVADLDRVMTIEKPLVATWKRTPGWASDSEARTFALALSRKRIRFAFPGDFNSLVEKLQRRIANKHEKNSDEGRGLGALQEIRVLATPSWDSTPCSIFFWFIRKESDPNFDGKNWSDLLKEWLKLVPSKGRFNSIEGQIATLEDMTAKDYVTSDTLDLDHLSAREK